MGGVVDFKSRYQAKQASSQGYVEYTAQEHDVWRQLYERQIQTLPKRACDEHLQGLEKLAMSQDSIPQLPDVNQRLKQISGWTVSPVEALISHHEFFTLLSNRIFPAATFIRSQDELDYLKEPDIFHELFGHCPMLTQPDFADFTQKYAEKVLAMPETDWPLMQRLFWFTVEFGLIQTPNGLRAYGGGILSSIGETSYSVESPVAMRILYDPLVVFRTPYRIDEMQPIYFVIDSYRQLFDSINQDLKPVLAQSRTLGEFPPLFTVEDGNPNIHIQHCC